jgi:hypothetical protein
MLNPSWDFKPMAQDQKIEKMFFTIFNRKLIIIYLLNKQ